MDEPPVQALRFKKDSSMRVAVNLVKSRRGARLRERRQHRRADGDLALRAEDARPASTGPAIATVLPNMQRRLHLRARPRRQRGLHARAADAVRRHGRDAGRGGRAQGAPVGRPAQHRRRGHQGQRDREAGRRAAARERPQLLRQRRGRRHLQGHHRRGGVRRLRRQLGAEGLRGRGQDDRRLPAPGVHAQSAGASSSALDARCRCSRRCARAWIRAATTARACSA